MASLRGVVDEVVFRNDQNGWTVLSVRSGRDCCACVGELPPVKAGEEVSLTGTWTEHRVYGRQLKIETCEFPKPETVGAIERYLASGTIRGIGLSTAKEIVARFGEDALRVLEDTPERLTEIPGIGRKRAAMIEESYRAQLGTRAIMLFLQQFGIGAALAAKVRRALGDQAEALIRADPYLLTERVEGVGFRTADEIAASLGIAPEDDHRVVCGALYALNAAVHGEGHTYLPYEVLIKRAAALLAVPAPLIERAVMRMTLAGTLRRREDAVYPASLYAAEAETAAMLAKIARENLQRDAGMLAESLAAYERESDLTLDGEQRAAVLGAAGGAIAVITGGPGTGKTTCLRCILHLLRETGKVLLCAPTGRAARRMRDATGCEAFTIHRLLEYSGEAGGFTRNAEHPLKASAVIVDEMSMVDLYLMRSLLDALPGGVRLVLVGDADQLPSVGAGNVLRDIIDSGAIPVHRLTEIYRQMAKSMIVVNAHKILRGDMPIANGDGSDFFFERAESPSRAAAIVEALATARLPRYTGLTALGGGIQIMAPMKKGEAGVHALNARLQAALNPPDTSKRETVAGGTLLRAGDKVMQVRNNYDIEWTRGEEQGEGVFNGDIGFIEEIGEDGARIRFDDDRVATYSEDEMTDVDLAYCISVHKSQGSEFEVVILPLIGGAPLLFTRNLLYTAVTRAKKLVMIVGSETCVRAMIANNHIAKRYSALAERLREAASTGSARPAGTPCPPGTA